MQGALRTGHRLEKGKCFSLGNLWSWSPLNRQPLQRKDSSFQGFPGFPCWITWQCYIRVYSNIWLTKLLCFLEKRAGCNQTLQKFTIYATVFVILAIYPIFPICYCCSYWLHHGDHKNKSSRQGYFLVFGKALAHLSSHCIYMQVITRLVSRSFGKVCFTFQTLPEPFMDTAKQLVLTGRKKHKSNLQRQAQHT